MQIGTSSDMPSRLAQAAETAVSQPEPGSRYGHQVHAWKAARGLKPVQVVSNSQSARR